jgi:transposase
MAYAMRPVLQSIYERKDSVKAKELFRYWCAWVQAMRGETGELLEPIARNARKIEGRLEGIFAYWTRGLTTASMEGINNSLLAMKREACRYWAVEYMITMLSCATREVTLQCY